MEGCHCPGIGNRIERLGVCLCGADSCEAQEECKNKPSLNGSHAVPTRTGNAVLFLGQHSSAVGPVCSWLTLKCDFCRSRKPAISWIFQLRYVNAITEEALTSSRVVSACIAQFLPLCLRHQYDWSLHYHPHFRPSLQLTARLGLPSPISFLLLLPPEYHSLFADGHPRTTTTPLTSRQQYIVQGSSCHSWTSFAILWVRSPLLLVSRVSSWSWRRWIWAAGLWQSWDSARSFQGHAATAGKTRSFEWNKPQEINEL